VLPAEDVQLRDVPSLAREALAHLSGAQDGYWIHVDVDVLDSDTMPAVDSPQPGGLQPDRLAALIRELWASDQARGLDLTIYDPELDTDGALAQLLSTMLRDALKTA
jgi:arginase